MRLEAYGASRGTAGAANHDCFCLGPIVGDTSVRLEFDASSEFARSYGLLAAVADAEPDGLEPSASSILLNELTQRFYSWNRRDHGGEVLRASVGTCLDEANQALLSRLADQDRVTAHATLAGVALLEPDVAVVFHVGNCRVLRDAGGYLRALTQDHSQERSKIRSISPSSLATFIEPAEPELTRFLGLLGSGAPDMRFLNWSSGDTYLVGTRGWHGDGHGIARDAIKTAINAYPDLVQFVDRSLREAVNSDGTDATLVAVRVV